jgi:hypothetical protein
LKQNTRENRNTTREPNSTSTTSGGAETPHHTTPPISQTLKQYTNTKRAQNQKKNEKQIKPEKKNGRRSRHVVRRTDLFLAPPSPLVYRVKFTVQHTWALAEAWPINVFLFSKKKKTIETKKKKGKTISHGVSLSLLERPDQSTTTTPVSSYATTTTHHSPKSSTEPLTRHPPVIVLPLFSLSLSLSLFLTPNPLPFSARHGDSTQFQVIVFTFR